MENKVKQTIIKLADGGLATWTFQKNLIMLHTDSTTAQWSPESLSVEIVSQELNVKVGMHPSIGVNHQNWYFEIKSHSKLLEFFNDLGFVCCQSTTFTEQK